MKIVVLNRSFLDYRVPVFEAIDVLCGGELWVICSRTAVPQHILSRLEQTLGERLIALDGEKIWGASTSSSQEMANASVQFPFHSDIVRHLKKIKPDVLFSEGFFQWTWMALWYKLFRRTPLVISYERTEHTERRAQWYRRSYRYLASKFIWGYAVNGSMTKAYLRRHISRTAPIIEGQMVADVDGLIEQYNGVTEDERQNLRSSLGLASDADGLVYLFVGQLIRRKGIAELLDAWRVHQSKTTQDARLVLVGYGTQRSEFEAKVARDGIPNVQFLGHISNVEIHKYYAAADVFVMPTLEDNWSLVVPEAMSCKLPILTTIYNGCWPELVTQENGRVIDPFDTDEFAKAIEEFATYDRCAMGEQSLRIVRRNTPQQAAEKIFSLFVRATKSSVSSHGRADT